MFKSPFCHFFGRPPPFFFCGWFVASTSFGPKSTQNENEIEIENELKEMRNFDE
jgi:hypothetical protein